MADSIEQLSFELTVSALAEQERALSGLRVRAGTILGAASIAGSFLGANTGGRPTDVWGIAATISFVLCSASAIWVLLPRELVFAFGGHKLLEDEPKHRRPRVADAYRVAGNWIEPHLERNQLAISHLVDWLTASCVLLALEVLLWTLSLAG